MLYIKMNTLDNVPDYVVLYHDDASVTGNRLKWNLPSSFYSNQRGQVCYVSLSSCNLSIDEQTEIIVKYMSGGQNIFSTKNSGAFLGTLYEVGNAQANDFHFSYESAEHPKILTSARPTTVELAICDNADDPLEIDSGVFVLKFEYLNTENTNNQYINTFTKTINNNLRIT